MLDGLSLNNDEEDHSSVDSDSDASDDILIDQQLPGHSNSLPSVSSTSYSAQKDKKPSGQEASSVDSAVSSKTVQWSNSDQFRQGLFRSCVVDMSAGALSAKSTHQELPSSCDNSVETTCSFNNFSKKVAEEQTTLERVKSCMLEWKTAELVAYLRATPTETTNAADGGHDSAGERSSDNNDVNKDSIESSRDRHDETMNVYERKVDKFYGAKPRVRFADSSKQVR